MAMTIYDIHIANLIIWTATGAVVGLLSALVFSEQTKGGIVTTLLMGIIGSLLGGFISARIFTLNTATINTESSFAALAGAVILSLIHRFAFKEKQLIRTRVTNLQ